MTRAGFTLLEVVMSVALLGVIVMGALQLMRLTNNSVNLTAQVEQQTFGRQAVIRCLRDDLRLSAGDRQHSEVSMQLITLDSTGRERLFVKWAIDDGGTVTRAAVALDPKQFTPSNDVLLESRVVWRGAEPSRFELDDDGALWWAWGEDRFGDRTDQSAISEQLLVWGANW